MSTTVLLADDQSMVRAGFRMILESEPDLEVVGEAANGEQAAAAARRLRPDVVLMDIQMPGGDGLEATRRIAQHPELDSRVVILTTFERDDYVFEALHAGASGFLLKNAEPDQLVDAVRAVGHGHALLAPEVTRRVIARMTTARTTRSRPDAGPPPGAPVTGIRGPAVDARVAGLERLTDREREILVLVARGMSNSEIAAHLFLGEATVKTHVSNCLAKLHLRDRVQAVVLAYEAGLVLPAEG